MVTATLQATFYSLALIAKCKLFRTSDTGFIKQCFHHNGYGYFLAKDLADPCKIYRSKNV